MKLNLRLDCNPAYEGSTFNLDKSTDTQPDSAYELVHYSTERQRLESKAHEYEIPDAMAGGAGSGNTGASVSGEKVGTRERSKSETDDLERTYMVIQS